MKFNTAMIAENYQTNREGRYIYVSLVSRRLGIIGRKSRLTKGRFRLLIYNNDGLPTLKYAHKPIFLNVSPSFPAPVNEKVHC